MRSWRGLMRLRRRCGGEVLYGVQPPLTDAVVQGAECQLGVCLPVSLLEIDLGSGRARAVQGACAPVVPIDLADDEPLEARMMSLADMPSVVRLATWSRVRWSYRMQTRTMVQRTLLALLSPPRLMR